MCYLGFNPINTYMGVSPTERSLLLSRQEDDCAVSIFNVLKYKAGNKRFQEINCMVIFTSLQFMTIQWWIVSQSHSLKAWKVNNSFKHSLHVPIKVILISQRHLSFSSGKLSLRIWVWFFINKMASAELHVKTLTDDAVNWFFHQSRRL